MMPDEINGKKGGFELGFKDLPNIDFSRKMTVPVLNKPILKKLRKRSQGLTEDEKTSLLSFLTANNAMSNALN